MIYILAAILLTTVTMDTMAQDITGRELGGDMVDPAGWASTIAGPRGGPMVAIITGELQAHQVPGQLRVSQFALVFTPFLAH